MESNKMDLKHLVDKVMENKEFYYAFKENPTAALADQGVELTREQTEALNKINWKVLDEIAEAFGYFVT